MRLLLRDIQNIQNRLAQQEPKSDVKRVSIRQLQDVASKLQTKLETGFIVDATLSKRLLHETDRLQDQTGRYERWWPSSDFLGTLPDLLIALTAVGAVGLLFFYPPGESFMQRLTQSAERIDLFGMGTISLTPQARKDAEQVFDSFRDKRNTNFQELAESYGIKQKLDKVMNEIEADLPVCDDAGTEKPEIRATIHVKDILFADTLYQLVDYYGQREHGRGRAFTIRFGIIGRAWRFEESLSAGPMGSDKDQLILRYGYKKNEASRSARDPKKTFIAHVLKSDKGENLGVLFIDSVQELEIPFDDAESEASRSGKGEEISYRDSELHQRIEDELSNTGLQSALANLVDDLEDNAIRLDVHER
jgi:hypothetical protein